MSENWGVLLGLPQSFLHSSMSIIFRPVLGHIKAIVENFSLRSLYVDLAYCRHFQSK